MRRSLCGGRLLAALSLVGAGALGCNVTRDARPALESPPPGVQATTLDYVDTAGFDALFESALTNQDPVIVVRTHTPRPDWQGRLNAWIAAWNRGGRVGPGCPTRARLQAPGAPLAVNGESIREFRLLVDDLMGRVEDLARQGSAWWTEEKVQARRVALLKPYNLRFHLDEDGDIRLIFFNGRYSRHYREAMQSLATADDGEPEGWARVVSYSRCRRRAQDQEAVRRAARATGADG